MEKHAYWRHFPRFVDKLVSIQRVSVIIPGQPMEKTGQNVRDKAPSRASASPEENKPDLNPPNVVRIWSSPLVKVMKRKASRAVTAGVANKSPRRKPFSKVTAKRLIAVARANDMPVSGIKAEPDGSVLLVVGTGKPGGDDINEQQLKDLI
jgi:hypothetical protein